MHNDESALKDETQGAPLSPTIDEQDIEETSEIEEEESGITLWINVDKGLIFITLIHIVGWLAVYFLILMPLVDQNSAQVQRFNSQLAQLQNTSREFVKQLETPRTSSKEPLQDNDKRALERQVRRLEATTVRLENQLAKILSRAEVTPDPGSILQNLRPNLIFGKFEFTFLTNEDVKLEHEIKNIGANAAIIAAPNVQLSLNPITGDVASDAPLEIGRDYAVRVYQPGTFQSGYASRVSYSIKLLNQSLKGSPVYYELQWRVSTDPLAVSSAARILGKQTTNDELNRLSQFTQRLQGTITFPR